jgi:hypothetical protein
LFTGDGESHLEDQFSSESVPQETKHTS